MLSELALVDWIALLIALVLLGIAGFATYLSLTNNPTRIVAAPARPPKPYAPSHALMSTSDQPALPDNFEPRHALVGDSRTGPQEAQPVLPDAPAPPILRSTTSQSRTGRSANPNQTIDLSDLHSAPSHSAPSEGGGQIETVADRAARLRSRPVAETEAPAIPALAPDDPDTLVFANGGKKLNVAMEPAPGFTQRQPGFFSDPVGRHELRYWNGSSWTEYVKEGADRFIDPYPSQI